MACQTSYTSRRGSTHAGGWRGTTSGQPWLTFNAILRPSLQERQFRIAAHTRSAYEWVSQAVVRQATSTLT